MNRSDKIAKHVEPMLASVPDKMKPIMREFYSRVLEMVLENTQTANLPAIADTGLYVLAATDPSGYTATELVTALQNMMEYGLKVHNEIQGLPEGVSISPAKPSGVN